ncbi:hypothetical protein [Paenibacillus campi]|uniref:hypothetical protein n=1 Tax=Paenibacillus campi TaxID=3106031 RepID=UPI002AFE23D1|nr:MULTISPECIES: hypothetical protein [unclassified Paenibacillus]
MLLITKRSLNRLAAPYREADMLMCHAIPQHMTTPSTRAILLMNEQKLVVVFLNLFLTRVVHTEQLALTELQGQKFKSGVGLAAVWSFQAKGANWRFQIMWTMLTLGSMQRDFLEFLQAHIVD